MSKIFYLLPSILIVGKLIASDPVIHPGYSDDISLAQPTVRIPATEQPALPLGTTTVKYPLQKDQDVVLNPVSKLVDDALGIGVVNPSDAQKLTIQPVDDSLGVAKPLPLPLVVTPDEGELGLANRSSVMVNQEISLPKIPPTVPSDSPKAAKSNYRFLPYVALGVGAVGLLVAILRSGIFSSARKK